MKLIIAGGRNVQASVEEIDALIQHFNIKPTEIVSGTAGGIDQCGEIYAKEKGIFLKKFPADWDKFGKSAGYKRNKQMADYADELLLIWDGESKGSGHMRTIMLDLKKPVHEAKVDPQMERWKTLLIRK